MRERVCERECERVKEGVVSVCESERMCVRECERVREFV